MIKSLLIANRGEIAVRIAKTAKRLGIETIAVASDVDRTALHARKCDRVIHLPGNTAGETYLRKDLILAAAQDTGAEAIHPGYGFLSEDPDFAQEVMDAGLIWVGPPPSAIRAMGLKDAAKSLMEKAGVPVVPGYSGTDQSLTTLAKAANEIGYPVLIKAVAGGGGKGMRRVDNDTEFEAALTAARNEAKSAFGNDDVLIEKFISNPRHIEFQVFSDGHSTVHLMERDCSLQRRHQKVLEEAPAPGMTDKVRAEVGAISVRAAEAIKYVSAGTIEFIVDGSGALTTDKFYFMEMNTRLQVEHPVTEAVLGEDLVEWQLRVAGGEPLPKTQDQLVLNGHSVEARIYAENPEVGFLPCIGTLSELATYADARFDSGVAVGDAVSPFYDPMIAKLIVHAADRSSAWAKIKLALDKTQVAGVVINRDFLMRLAGHKTVLSGQATTGLIDENLSNLVTQDTPAPFEWALAGVALVGKPPAHAGFSLHVASSQNLTLNCGAETKTIGLDYSNSLCRVRVNDAPEILVSFGKSSVFLVERPNMQVHVDTDVATTFGATTHEFQSVDLRDRQSKKTQDKYIRAPMPGQIVKVHVAKGDDVDPGAALITLEAMKMQHTLTAELACSIESVFVSDGDQVSAQADLVEVSPKI